MRAWRAGGWTADDWATAGRVAKRATVEQAASENGLSRDLSEKFVINTRTNRKVRR
jgi:hypothetical protein